MRYDRTDILGVIKPERIPNWAKERIAVREQNKTTPPLER